jgi:phosphate transport system substrate-binding protein
MTFPGALLAVSCVVAFASTAAADNLAVVGTGDGMPVLQALGKAFTAKRPQTNILVPPSVHSSGGIRQVNSGEAVLGRIARPLKGSELELGLRVTPVFRQPTAFFVHPSAGVTNLSAEQLTNIFTGSVTNWRDVGGADERVRVVRREEVDSSLAVLRDTLPGWKDLKFDEDRSKLATTTQEAFQTVEEVPGAVGFGPYSPDLEKRFVVLRVDGIFPSDPRYPSAVTLFLIHRDATVTEPALSFIDFIFTAQAQRIIRDNGAVPITSRQTM